MAALLKSLLFCCWAVFLGWLVSWGRLDLAHFLHPRLWWIVAAGAVVLAFFFLATIGGIRRNSSTLSSAELSGIVVLFVPLLFFPVARHAQLDSRGLEERLSSSRNAYPAKVQVQKRERPVAENPADSFQEEDTWGGDNGGGLPLTPPVDSYNPLSVQALNDAVKEASETPLSSIVFQREEYDGKRVTLICKTAESKSLPTLPPGIVLCYRYLITCCIADALPIYLLVQPQEKNVPDSDRWVKLVGTISYIPFNGEEIPMMLPDSLQYVPEPAFPWVF